MTYYPPQSPMQTGMAGKCPRCGQGDLFEKFITLCPSCSVCGLDYSKADSGDGPAVFLIFILGFLAVALMLFLEFVVDAPTWLVLLLSIGFTLLLAVMLIRPLKGVLIAQQYAQKAAEGQIGQEDQTE